MVSLSGELYNRCHTVLGDCQYFETNQTLRAFVKLNLYGFHIGLPEADNLNDRVTQCLAYLIDQNLSSGDPVLPVFLARLRDSYPVGHPERDKLDSLQADVAALYIPIQNRNGPDPHHSSKLFDLLLRLNFRLQVKKVREVIDEKNIAAFLIHGLPDYGQRTLVYRLSRLRPGWEEGQRIIVKAGASGIGNSSRSLWREIASRADRTSDTDPLDLSKIVCDWLRSQDVIFVIHTVDYIPIKILSTWLDEFWKPLVSMVRQQANVDRSHDLVLFMVDYKGIVEDNGLQIVCQPENSSPTDLPLLLPKTALFPKDELDIWLDTATEVLPSRIEVQSLLETTQNGIPDLVYEKICAHCGVSWEALVGKEN